METISSCKSEINCKSLMTNKSEIHCISDLHGALVCVFVYSLWLRSVGFWTENVQWKRELRFQLVSMSIKPCPMLPFCLKILVLCKKAISLKCNISFASPSCQITRLCPSIVWLTADSELGVHVDGYTASLAHTIVVNDAASSSAPLLGSFADCVCAAHFATELVSRNLRPGTEVFDFFFHFDKLTYLINLYSPYKVFFYSLSSVFVVGRFSQESMWNVSRTSGLWNVGFTGQTIRPELRLENHFFRWPGIQRFQLHRRTRWCLCC